jgi:YggT family protein
MAACACPARRAGILYAPLARTNGGIMFIIGHLLNAVATILDLALSLYMWILIARAVISWVNPDPYNPIVRFLYSVTDPVLYRIRRIVPLYFGGIDFSPMILILAIVFVQSFLIATLKSLAFRLM